MILHHLILLKLIFLFISIQCLAEESVRRSKIIRTPEGQVQGLVVKTVLRQMEYLSFRGIPYAQPPVGDLRFKPPVKFTRKDKGSHPGYYQVFLAMRDANMCRQYDVTSNTVLGNEDCLYLNVYTPEIEFNRESEKRAVMVWIHGGAFMWGSNNSTKFGPDYLVEKNVVVVAMNYRLGAFGFITAGNDITGNMGLKDQAMALQWVKDNIAYFGGDPNKVTIFGESAGSVSVELHRLSPSSRGLFRASIAMSGSPLNPWAFSDRKDAKDVSDEIVNRWHSQELGVVRVDRPLTLSERMEEHAKGMLDYLVNDPPTRQEKLDLLKNATADDIVRHTDAILNLEKRIPFLPTIERPNPSGDFLSKMPEDLYKRKLFNSAPHIIGYTSDEMIGIPEIFYPIYSRLPNALNDIAKITLSQLAFFNGIDKTFEYILKKDNVRVWKYENSFDYPQSLHRLAGVNKKGCGHADDVAHIFYEQGKNQPLDFESDFAKQRERIVTLWTNFAKYLNPTANTSSIGNIQWPSAVEHGYYLEFDKSTKLVSLDRTDFEEFIEDDVEFV